MNKSELGKLGLWATTGFMPIDASVSLAQQAEKLGYGCIWVPDMIGREQFAELALMARATSELKLATGITSIYARDPGAMVSGRNALDEISGGRFVLGLGVSHREVVAAVRKHEYGKPLTAMRNYLEAMKTAPYQSPPPAKQGLVVLAGLKERMIKLGAEQTDGVHPFFVTPEHTAKARETMGPDALLAPEQHVLMIKDPSEARRVARQHMALHLGLENYRGYLKTFDFSEEDFENGGSDRLVDAIVAWGDETAIMKRVEEHWKNGADHVAIQPLTHDGSFGVDMKAIEALAPA